MNMANKRKKFSPEEKVRLLRLHLIEKEPVSDICGTFYYLCSILDGFSHYIIHWEIREAMKESDVEMILAQRDAKLVAARKARKANRKASPTIRPRGVGPEGSGFRFAQQCNPWFHFTRKVLYF